MAYPTNWDGITASTTPRFIIDAADAADPAGDGSVPALSGPFPFAIMDGVTATQGAWTGNGNNYSLNADPDGDGVNRSVLHRPGYSDSANAERLEYFVPMVAINIRRRRRTVQHQRAQQ